MVEHPEPRDLGALGAEMRAEWRAETEAATQDALEQRQLRQSLEQWLTERMHAGDRVAVSIAEQRFAGFVEETGDDLVAVRAVFGRVDVHRTPAAPLYIEIHEHATSGGSRAEARRNFHDALLARDGHDTSVGTLHDPEGVDGTLRVGTDFVSIVARLGAETIVPLEAVLWATARRS